MKKIKEVEKVVVLLALLFLTLPLHNIAMLDEAIVRKEKHGGKNVSLSPTQEHQSPVYNTDRKKKPKTYTKSDISRNSSSFTKPKDQKTASLIESNLDSEHNLTIMLYLNGDNWRDYFQQEAVFIKEFLDAAKVGSSTNVTIVCQLDRYRGGTEKFGNWTNTRRFVIQKGMKPYPNNTLENLHEKNMGSPDVLKNFIFWTFDHYPAEKYVLMGLVRNSETYSDQNAVYVENDWLGVKEFTTALRTVREKTGESIDVVLPYVPGIGSTSPLYCTAVSYGLQNISHGIVLPHHAYDSSQTYFLETILTHINHEPALSPLELAKTIAEIQYNQSDGRRTVSALNISAYADSLQILNQLSKQLLRNDYYCNDTDVQEAFEDSAACLGSDDTYDLLNLSQELQIHKSNRSVVHELSNQLEMALRHARIFFNKDPGGYPIPLRVSGIFVQLDSHANSFLGEDWSTIHAMQFGKETFWDEFWKVKQNYTVSWVHETTLSTSATSQSVNVSFNIDSNLDTSLTLRLYGNASRGELLLREENRTLAGNIGDEGDQGNWTVTNLRFPYSGTWDLKVGLYGKTTGDLANTMYPGVPNQSRKLTKIAYDNGNFPEVKITSPRRRELITTNKLEIAFQVNSSTEYNVFSRVDKQEWRFQGSCISTLFVNVSLLWDWTSYNHTSHWVQLKIQNEYGSIQSVELPIRINNNDDTVLIVANGKVRDFIPEGFTDLGLGEAYNLTRTYNETHSKLSCFAPSAAEMSKFETVFWLEGRDNSLNLTKYHQENIAQYLTNYSGSIAISGDRLAQTCNRSAPRFLHTFLKATYIGEAVGNATFTNEKAVFHGLTSSKTWGDYVAPKGDAKKTIVINGSAYGGGIQYCNEYKMLFTATLPKNTGFDSIEYINRSIQFLNTSKPAINIQKPCRTVSYSNSTQPRLVGEVIDRDYMGAKLYINESFVDTLDNPWNITYAFPTEGTYLLTFKSWDTIRHYTKTKLFVTIDLTPPSLVITYPDIESETYWCKEDVCLRYKAQDLSFHCTKLYRNDSLVKTLDSEGRREISEAWNEGTYNVWLKAIDKAGNANKSCTIRIKLDTTKPEIAADLQKYSNVTSYRVNWTFCDNYHLKMCQITTENTSWMNVSSTGNYTFSLEEGNHTIFLKAVDMVGHEARFSKNVTIDLTPPLVAITSPLYGTWFASSRLELRWNGSDPYLSHYELKVTTDGVWTDIGERTQKEISGLSTGIHKISVTAVDKAANTNKDVVSIRVDLETPRAQIMKPDRPVTLQGFTLSWYSTDSMGLQETSIYVNDTLIQIYSNTSVESHVFQNMQRGPCNITLKVCDNVNRTAVDHIQVEIRSISFSLLPSTSHCYIDERELSLNWKAEGRNLQKVEIYLEEEKRATLSWKALRYTVTLGKNVSDGNYSLKASIIDSYGNAVSDSLMVTLDTAAPDIRLSSPSNATFCNSTFNITWSGNDIYKTEIYVNGTKVATTPHCYYQSNIPTGKYTFFLKARDHAGNSQNSSCIVVYVDKHVPRITLLTPKRTKVDSRKNLNITWNIAENYPFLNVSLFLDDTLCYVSTSSSGSFTVSNLTVGKHILKVEAVDKAGNSNVTSLTIQVVTSNEGHGYFYDVILNVLTIFLLSFGLLLTIRGGKKIVEVKQR